jgi:surfeit locus 1 family protein
LYTLKAPKWGVGLLILGLLLTTRLGVWQLNRADEKRLILQASTAAGSAYELSQMSVPPKAYQTLLVSGHFLDRPPILLDNQFYQHQIGYQVLRLFKAENGRILLINQGWVEKSKAQSGELWRPRGRLRLKGDAYYPSVKQWLLGEFSSEQEGPYRVIEVLDLQKIETLIGVRLPAFVFRLSKDSQASYQCEWASQGLSPNKHLAYALQWFSFAIAMLVIFLSLTVRPLARGNENE